MHIAEIAAFSVKHGVWKGSQARSRRRERARMLNWFRSNFSSNLAIDLGTTSTRIGLPAEGIRLDEPSVVAVGQGQTGVLAKGTAVGRIAAQMIGRTPDGIRAVRPIAYGVISDFELAESMLRYFMQKASGRRLRMRPRVLITIPACITPVEKRAVINSAERAGAGQIRGSGRTGRR